MGSGCRPPHLPAPSYPAIQRRAARNIQSSACSTNSPVNCTPKPALNPGPVACYPMTDRTGFGRRPRRLNIFRPYPHLHQLPCSLFAWPVSALDGEATDVVEDFKRISGIVEEKAKRVFERLKAAPLARQLALAARQVEEEVTVSAESDGFYLLDAASPQTIAVDHLAHQYSAAARGSRPGTPPEPFRSSQQHLARDELPQQRHDAQTAPSPAPPRHTAPARTTRAAARLQGRPPPATSNRRRAHRPSHHLLAPRSPDNQPRPRSGPGRPARRHLLPRHGHAAAARSAQPHHPPPQQTGTQGRRPGFLPPSRRHPTRAGHPDEDLGPTSPPLKMRPAATAARAGGSGGRGRRRPAAGGAARVGSRRRVGCDVRSSAQKFMTQNKINGCSGLLRMLPMSSSGYAKHHLRKKINKEVTL
nr:uncharacterized protein LOC127316214 [Lolium perenne]